ncbi:MAG: acyl-homoserine-lactone acylase [Planctomycetota bacterium]|jgi:acyl-homoserine-lactone acylase
MRRAKFLALIMALCLPGFWSCQGSVGLPQAAARARVWEAADWSDIAREVTIHRDEWGVPHVFGPTDASVVFGFAYARAEDEFERVERAVYLMLGRNSEVLGEEGLAWDKLVHACEIPQRAQAEYSALEAPVRVLADAWAAGMNLYAARRAKAALIERFEPWHLLAQGYALHLHALAGELRKFDPELAPPSLEDGADGSNVWALAPAKSASGKAMLMANPHMPFEEVYEGHLCSEEGLEITGVSAYGRGALPMLGATQSVAWSLAVNKPDITDTWRVRFERAGEGMGRTYRVGGQRRQATSRAVSVLVRDADGVLQARELRWLETHYGPVLAMDGDVGYAMAVAGLERGGALGTAYAMARATNVDGLFEALRGGGLLFHNVLAADAGGHIGFLYNALVPSRDGSLDWTRPVDGNDARSAWHGYHRQEDLAQVRDPESGWLQNCNSRAESTVGAAGTGLSDPPRYLAGYDTDDGRVAMSQEILGREQAFDFEEWCAAPFDRRVFRAQAWIRALAGELKSVAARNPARARVLAEPLALLEAWDGVVSVESEAATLFLWTYEYLGRNAQSGPPLVSALESTVRQLRRAYGSWRVAWGLVNRHQRASGTPARHSDDRASWPVAGGHGAAGLAWTFLARDTEGTRARYGYHGHSYLAAIELGSPPRIRSIVPYGSSRDPRSRHFQDQAPLFARGDLKQAWFTRADVRAHAQRSYSPGSR